MKRIIIPAIAIVLAFAGSAFTTAKRSNSNLFVYAGSSYSQTDIQTASNYVATSSDPCSGATNNICAVNLPTAKPLGQHPAAADFSAEEGNLWRSQQGASPYDDNIEMKP
jgi:hypothetical protein